MKIFVPTAAECKLVTIDDASIQAFLKHNRDESISWVRDPRSADIIVLFEERVTRFLQYSEVLSEDPLFRTHWDRIFTINCDTYGRGFLRGCYTSLTKANFEPQLHRASAYPYVYNELVARAAWEKRSANWLFSFRGSDFSHPIRRKLFRCFGTYPRAKMVRTGMAFHGHSTEEKQEYIDDILSSKFVLCPRGFSPATCRLFEVMELGRCPVIISDDWVPINGVPWPECSVFIKERDIAYCAEILTREEANAERLGARAREVWEAHFYEENKFRGMLYSILELRSCCCSDYRTRWSSWRFRHGNGWLLHQRVAKGVGRRFETLQNSFLRRKAF
jgi:Exostosin family